MSKRAQKTSETVNLGKIVEKIVPSFASFAHAPGDCRALFEPIDYLIFSGLSSRSRVDSLHFVDVKSGKARLSPGQRSIKTIVEAGAVEFSTLEGEAHNG
jgi:predicted Holliday junction resolvase-like endonuclease